MGKSAFIRARIEPQVKVSAEKILHQLGITPTQAVTMLYKRLISAQQWPLELKIPNHETRKILDETDQGMGLIPCHDINDLFNQLDL